MSSQSQRAEQQKNKKIQFEAALYLLLLALLRKMARAVAKGSRDLNVFQSEFERLLNKSYGKISKSFRTIALKEVNVTGLKVTPINKVLKAFNSARAVLASTYILQTFQRKLGFLSEDGGSNKKIAVDFLAFAKTHIKSIVSTTEVQIVAENSKHATVSSVGLTTGVVYNFKWVTVGDDRVRLWHQEADGQIRPSGELFKVGDDYLKYPGDPSGSLANIINCRCALVINK